MLKRNTEDLPLAAPAVRNRYPVLKAAFVLYATLAILALATPGNVVNWLKGLKPSPAQEMLIPYAEKFEQEAEKLGIDTAYKTARGLFLRLTRKEDD